MGAIMSRTAFSFIVIVQGILCLGSSEKECISEHSQSQHAEETSIISHFFKNKYSGTYLEMGAVDGLQFSNTLAMHKCMGWSGILIEGLARNYYELTKNVLMHRPQARAFYGAVCVPPQDFVYFIDDPIRESTNGDISMMKSSFLTKFHSGGGKKLIKTPCKPMSEYLTGVPVVNFFSLDVEGAELEVIESTDFKATQFDVIMIEMDVHNPVKNFKIRQILFNFNFVECLEVVEFSAVFLNRNPSDSMLRCPYEETLIPSPSHVGSIDKKWRNGNRSGK
jgi:hypothetical protein